MKTVLDLSFVNKIALVRVDFNVPLDDELRVVDNSRILAAKPTISHILNSGGSCVLMSHLGRPKSNGRKLSLAHVVSEVEKVMNKKLQFVDQCIGKRTVDICKKTKPGEIILLENLRYHKEETLGDITFAKELSKNGDIYVNDAFGTSHREHSSTSTIAQFFQEKCLGILLNKEVLAIKTVLETGNKPVLAILGGAKVSSKITIINNILDKVDHLIIGGGMAYTFIKALGGEVGNSICENDKLELATQLLEKAKYNKTTIHLPVDVIAAEEFSPTAKTKNVDIYKVPRNWEGLDIGQQTIKNFDKIITKCNTILWNGPMGVFEIKQFSNGTKRVGESVVRSTEAGSFSLVGGGDSVSAVKSFGMEKRVSYVSTGGGAMLESLEGKVLPGILALQ